MLYRNIQGVPKVSKGRARLSDGYLGCNLGLALNDHFKLKFFLKESPNLSMDREIAENLTLVEFTRSYFAHCSCTKWRIK